MKRLATLLLTAVMLLSIVSCSGDVTVTGGDDCADIGGIEEKNNKQSESDESKAENTKKDQSKNYPDNILMDPYGTGGYVLFNRDIESNNIKTITFLDTLANMPTDAWDVSAAKDGSVMAWVTDGVNLYIAGEGGVTAESCNRLFGGYRNVVSIDFGRCFYTDLTDRLTEMFVYCHKLETLDLSGWNTSNVKYMSDAFYGCYNLKTVNLSGWDTSKVETMRCMFDSCRSLESLDVSHFDTSKVASFEWMFNSCKALTSIDASNWNTASAKTMAGMFEGCVNLTTVGELKIPENCETTNMFNDTPLT